MSSTSSSSGSALFRQLTPSTTNSSSFAPSPVKPDPGNRDIARDRFNPSTGARLVAGVVVLSNEHSHPGEVANKYVLCVSSSRHPNKLVLPKGGWEYHETVEEAALRECWEEAGVQCKVHRFLHAQADTRPPKDYVETPQNGTAAGGTKYKGMTLPPGTIPSRSEYQYFQVHPLQVHEDWPERDKRTRKWLTYKEAKKVFEDRSEMARSIELSDILRD